MSLLPARRRLHRRLGALAAATAASGLAIGSSGASKRRRLEVTESIRMELPHGSKEVRLWIPTPPTDPFQSAKIVGIEAPWPYQRTMDPRFRNQGLFLKARAPQPGPVAIRFRYEVSRREQAGAQTGAKPDETNKNPRGLGVITGEIRKIAEEKTRGLSDPMDKAKALYRYVLGHMAYDKTGSGWGRGDAAYACRVGKGNCTDFHSLFIALSMAGGIPARFRMGYPVPEGASGEIVSPYHCWAEFYTEDKGWIPVDISEAWKHKDKTDYYFGHLDENRVLVTTGREIRLEPPQKSKPLNYWSRPYAEVDGKPLENVELKRTFKELAQKI